MSPPAAFAGGRGPEGAGPFERVGLNLRTLVYYSLDVAKIFAWCAKMSGLFLDESAPISSSNREGDENISGGAVEMVFLMLTGM